MSGSPRSPARSPARLPAGVLGLDYLKFVQLSVDAELNREGSFDDGQLQGRYGLRPQWFNAHRAAGNEGLL
jgi:hypothetical protein